MGVAEFVALRESCRFCAVTAAFLPTSSSMSYFLFVSVNSKGRAVHRSDCAAPCAWPHARPRPERSRTCGGAAGSFRRRDCHVEAPAHRHARRCLSRQVAKHQLRGDTCRLCSAIVFKYSNQIGASLKESFTSALTRLLAHPTDRVFFEAASCLVNGSWHKFATSSMVAVALSVLTLQNSNSTCLQYATERMKKLVSVPNNNAMTHAVRLDVVLVDGFRS